MQCDSLFSGKNKKNISKCHQLKFLPSMQSVKHTQDSQRDVQIFREKYDAE